MPNCIFIYKCKPCAKAKCNFSVKILLSEVLKAMTVSTFGGNEKGDNGDIRKRAS